MAAAVLGLARARRRRRGRAPSPRRCPTSPRCGAGCWSRAGGGGAPEPGDARLDEDDVRIRPAARLPPPHRIRPAHEDAVRRMVIAVDRGRYTRRGRRRHAVVTAMRARELGRKGVVVGDRVALVGDVSGGADALARIVRSRPRACCAVRPTTPTRSSGSSSPTPTSWYRVALADPPPRPGFIDRCLVAAYDADLDRCSAHQGRPGRPEPCSPLRPARRAVRRHLRRDGRPTSSAARAAAGRTSVLVGHSGVGKSHPGQRAGPRRAARAGVVNAVTGKGRHTSTSAVALGCPAARLGHRHPRCALLRAGSRRPRAHHPALPRAGGRDRCPRGCTHDEGVRARRLGRLRPRAGGPARGWRRYDGCCAPAPPTRGD